MTRGTRMRRPTAPIASWCAAAASAAQLSKSKSLNSSSMARAAPWYRSAKARRTDVMWTGWYTRLSTRTPVSSIIVFGNSNTACPLPARGGSPRRAGRRGLALAGEAHHRDLRLGAAPVEEPVCREGAEDPLHVPARLLDRDLLDELVELEAAAGLHPPAHRPCARVVRREREGDGAAIPPHELAEVPRSEPDVERRVDERGAGHLAEPQLPRH